MADDALADASTQPSQVGRTSQPVAHKSEHYGDAEFLAHQPQLTDLVVQRPWVLGLAFAVGILVIAALEAACSYAVGDGSSIDGWTAIFDLTRRECLATWFIQTSLFATAIIALVVYSIRRHRTDDYQGRYRVWLWAAAAWFFVASDKMSGLHEALQQTLVHLSGTKLLGDGALWWMIPYLLIGGAIATRLFWDLRDCWPALTALATASTCYGVALIVRLIAIPDESILQRAMLQQGAEMAGHWLGLFAVCLFARHVLRDAEGRLPRREAKVLPAAVDKSAQVGENATKETDETASRPTTSSNWKAVDPAHPAPPAPVQSKAFVPSTPAAKPAPVAPSVSNASPPPTNHKLSKAEKKALKERLMRERLGRQQTW